jgi:RNA polymerase sigma-70 factor (ECF subfamily)
LRHRIWRERNGRRADVRLGARGGEPARRWQGADVIELLSRARAGDEGAFAELVGHYRGELRLHCYRILGSLADAEDLVQETLLAAWRGLPGFEGRASLRAWLYRIATNQCLNALRAGRRWHPPAVPPFQPTEPTRRGEATWLQPYPDALLDEVPDTAPGPEARYEQHEAVQLAFLAALQALPPRQAATLVLRDVLGYTTVDVASMLDTTPTAVKGALQRARSTLDHAEPAAAPPAGSAQEREVSGRFAAAFTAGDIDGLVALLSDDAWLAMPPAPHEYHGPAAIAAFLQVSGAWRGRRQLLLIPTRANMQPAFGCYLTEPDDPIGHPAGIVVLTLRSEHIYGMTRFLDSNLHERFGLPPTQTVSRAA